MKTFDPGTKHILEIAKQIAVSRAPVLISGESGTGKELLAKFIHQESPRSKNPFVAVNCAAVPEGLLESELFGFEKGAFTGADAKRIGKFELAHQSSFLLDEVSEMSLSLQAKLLRVLQEGEIQRLGGSHPIKVNVRVIATTNRDLASYVAEGQFREDLYYRLNVIPLTLPPLRERPLDIKHLSQYFLELSHAQNQAIAERLSDEAVRKLLSWSWPGNVRELQNVIERSSLLAKSETLNAPDILISNFNQSPPTLKFQPGMTVFEAERLLILKTLEFTEQNRTRAAELLGISIRTLRNKINEYKGVDL